MAKKAAATETPIGKFIESLEKATDVDRMAKVKKMLRADRFQLFSEVSRRIEDEENHKQLTLFE